MADRDRGGLGPGGGHRRLSGLPDDPLWDTRPQGRPGAPEHEPRDHGRVRARLLVAAGRVLGHGRRADGALRGRPGRARRLRSPRRQARLPVRRTGSGGDHPGRRIRSLTLRPYASRGGRVVSRRRLTMAVAALITWVVTAGLGFYMLRTWISNGGARDSGSSHFRPPVVFGHFLLA